MCGYLTCPATATEHRTKSRCNKSGSNMSKNFTFVLIPTGNGECKEITRSKAGGLENDELQVHAKKYFASADDGKVHAEVQKNPAPCPHPRLFESDYCLYLYSVHEFIFGPKIEPGPDHEI